MEVVQLVIFSASFAAYPRQDHDSTHVRKIKLWSRSKKKPRKLEAKQREKIEKKIGDQSCSLVNRRQNVRNVTRVSTANMAHDRNEATVIRS